jgi:hypothetical protein
MKIDIQLKEPQTQRVLHNESKTKINFYCILGSIIFRVKYNIYRGQLTNWAFSISKAQNSAGDYRKRIFEMISLT